MTQYISKDTLVAEIKERIKTYNKGYANGDDRRADALEVFLHYIDTLEVKEDLEIDENHKIGKWFTGLIPCWVDVPSTLQASHNFHGKDIVAIHLKNGGYRCCCVDDKEPITFSLPENVSLVEGWHNRKNSDIALVQQALDKARDLANTIEGALAGEEPFPATYYRMCQEIIEYLTKINKII